MINILKTSKSRLSSTDFSDLPFGRVFSDHMLVCHYKKGAWQEPQIIPYGSIPMNPGSQVLHYGQSVFEGMKAFKNSNNEVLFFRKEENFRRLNKSAIRLSIPEVPSDVFMHGLNELLALDSEWCKEQAGYSLYIRPFIFASSECIKASSSEEFTFIIITSPTTTYYPGEINLIIEESFTRACKGGVGFAKAAGNYAATFYPTKLANAKGFQQVIWTDANKHEYIEECGTMNIWFRVGDKLITPELSDSILSGVTRDSIITIAKDMDIDVQEMKIAVDDDGRKVHLGIFRAAKRVLNELKLKDREAKRQIYLDIQAGVKRYLRIGVPSTYVNQYTFDRVLKKNYPNLLPSVVQLL